jgi:hypothetical protein
MSRFLDIELDVGRTFAWAAMNSRWTGDVLHNRRLARKAYNTTARLISHPKLTDTDAKKLAKKMELLKLTLIQLGDAF